MIRPATLEEQMQIKINPPLTTSQLRRLNVLKPGETARDFLAAAIGKARPYSATLSQSPKVKVTGDHWPTILYMAPHKISGLENCTWAMICKTYCLVTESGKCGIAKAAIAKGTMELNVYLRARILRTWRYHLAPAFFWRELGAELMAHSVEAYKARLIPAFRFNGGSDRANWYTEAPDHVRGILSEFRLWDYTKCRELPASNWPVHKTFSVQGMRDLDAAREWLKAGRNVAMIFPKGHMPASWEGHPVLNGDDDDLRFLDPAGHICGLTAKGVKSANKERAGAFLG